jgi:hypothetical protein
LRINPLKPERERDGKDRLKVDSKRKSRGEVRDTLFSEGREIASFLEGSQATPARPCENEDVMVIRGGFRQTEEF